MTTKQKQSFFERLTGTKTLEAAPDHNRPTLAVFEESETEIITPMYNNNLHQHDSAPIQTPSHDAWQQGSASAEDTEGQLTIDVYQTDNDIVIKSTIAGVKPEDLDVAINNDMVTIKGERKNEEAIPQDSYYYQECYWGPFSRSILLPVDIISDKAEASLKNGILTIRLPKADVTKTKKIQVRGF
jgi:HSP20 family protein